MEVLQRVLGVLLGLAFFVAVFIFASLIVGALLAVGLVAWAWMWWRTRALRRTARGGAVTVEGEYRDVTPSQRLEQRDLRR
jgi:hypothetical protein